MRGKDHHVSEEDQRKIEETNNAFLSFWINERSKNEEGFSALHFAAVNGNIQIVRLLMQYGARPDIISN